MLLSEFLNYFDFDYEVVNGAIRFVDLQGAYLGDIGECRYLVQDDDKASIVDRLEIYIKDSVIDDLQEQLVQAGVADVDKMDLADMAKVAREKDLSCDQNIIGAILNPSSLEFETDKIIQSFSAGQIFFENDTQRYIVLENTCESNKDIWNFKVYDQNMKYLYDTIALDNRLAKDLIGGYLSSVTHEKVLRLEPDSMLSWKGKLSATLEENAKLWERFNDCHDPEGGELRYVTVDYNPKDDCMTFKLHFERYNENDLVVLRSTLEVPTEVEEKATLLKEMKFLQPGFFEEYKKARKPLDQVIRSTQKEGRKNIVVDINEFRKSKEGR